MEGHQNCWCLPCREAHLQQYSGMRMGRLLTMFRWDLRKETSEALDATFAIVMRRIVAAKAFKTVAERETGYRQVKRQLEAIFAGREFQGTLKKLARRINNSCWVYKNFNKIVQNVQECPLLDIRRFSLKDLYLAKNSHWFLARQELARERLRRPADLGAHIYRDEDFDDLLGLVRNSAAYQAVREDDGEVTRLVMRLQRQLLNFR